MSKGFGQFYANVNGVADNFAKFWKLMANEFKDLDNVLGYELINEPFAGDIYEAFSVLLPGMAGHVNLAPLYEKTAKVQYIEKDSKLLSRVFLLRQIWIVNYSIKNPSKILSNENKKTEVSRKIVCFGILIHILS